MARSSRTGGKASAAKARKSRSPKGHNLAKTKRRATAATTRLKRPPASDFGNELKEAREQQAATAEVLEAINRSDFDLDKILQIVVSTAARLCRTGPADIFLLEGDVYRFRAGQNLSEAYREQEKRAEIRPGLGTLVGRVALKKGVVHIIDALDDIDYEDKEAASTNNFRSMLGVPLLRDGEPIGVFALARTRVEPFSESQTRLVTTFANQAVIAIENARLFNETKEALERQIATAEILKVIASSPDNVQPVFDAIAHSANRLIGGFVSAVHRVINDVIHVAAFTPTNPISDAALRAAFPMHRSKMPPVALLQNGETVQIADSETADAEVRQLGRARGWRSVTFTPLMNHGVLIGYLTSARRETGVLAEHHVQLLRTFADQAVIAIENARLFNETKEALEQQTATSEVLQVISSSRGDLDPVFQKMLENACRVCEANFGIMQLWDGGNFNSPAAYNVPPALAALRRNVPIRPHPLSGLYAAMETRRVVHRPDVRETPAYRAGVSHVVEMADVGGARTLVIVPMLKDDQFLGSITMYRQEVRPFTDKQVALVENFTKQAVIAIENTRLLRELRERTADLSESLQQQTATADVLKIISRSAFDLEGVMNALVRSAAELCSAQTSSLYIREGDLLTSKGIYAADDGVAEFIRANPLPVNDRSLGGRVVLTGSVVNIGDAESEDVVPLAKKFSAAIGFRALLVMPLMRDGRGIGVFSLTRKQAGKFSQREIGLVQTFADQAVIAIENVRLFDETQEALERQTATADILKVIASSPDDVQPVFEAIGERANKLVGAHGTTVLRIIGDLVELAAFTPVGKEADAVLRSSFPLPIAGNPHYEKMRRGEIAEAADTEAAHSPLRDIARARGYRSRLLVPLKDDSGVVGAISVTRKEPGAFAAHHVQLLQTFADQAVIAIQNVRLFNETKEALERQTATSDVLRVIGSSPGDLQPVFDIMLENATRICAAQCGILYRCSGDALRTVATHGAPPAFVEERKRNPIVSPNPDTTLGRALSTKEPVQIADILAEIDDLNDRAGELPKLAGARTVLAVPMVKGNELMGAILIYRQEVRPFTDKQIELVKNFAAQSVIAIENTRLLNELRESLQQQTATADVLKVISRSSVDLGSVLDTLVETAARLCRAEQATMYRRQEEDKHYLVAAWGMSEAARQFALANPRSPGRGSLTGRVLLEHRAVHVPDVLGDPEYTYGEGQRAMGYRSLLGIPLLREDALLGVFAISRTRLEAFTDKEIELATTFADQAVIAIENARLFEELHERQAELRVTFDNMGDGVAMFGADKRLAAWNRNFQAMLDLPEALLINRPSFAELFRYLAARGEFGSADLEEELSRSIEDTRREMRYERMRPDGRVVEVRRNPVPDGGFVLIYADITERKRAEEAIRLARDAAEKALLDLQKAQDRLVQTEKLASLGQLTAGIAHEIKNPLNFVNNFSALSAELVDEMTDVFQNPALDEAGRRKELDDIRELLKSNLEKIVQHGKRADSIVKNMLLHSREGRGERRTVDINSLVEESLNLAYHGARAEGRDFNISLERDFDPAVGVADVYPQEITRVLLNLISNGFYAATQRAGTAGNGFEPRLKAITRNLGDRVEVRICDNGTGIPPEVKDKMFNPFFTTKPAGEGTGLGLSMSHDIVVKQHSGTIDVETEPGAFTEIIVTLPRATGTPSI